MITKHTSKNLVKVSKSESSIVYKTKLDRHGLVFVKKYDEKINTCFEYIVREINILLKINHPNLIKLLEIWPSTNGKNMPGLVFENGGSDLLNFSKDMSRHKKIELFKPIFGQILNALDYLHTNNIIHRDIKPSNILINNIQKNIQNNIQKNIQENIQENIQKNIVKICDFGLSRSLSGNMSPKTCTPNYRAPELLDDSYEYDTKIDIWALGCVIYEYIENDILFVGKNTTKNSHEHDVKILINIKNKLSGDFIEWMFHRTRYAKSQHINLPIYQNLTQRLLSYDPTNRPTANECIKLLDFENSEISKTPQLFLIRKTTSIDLNIRHVIVANLMSLDTYYEINYQTIALSIDIYDKWLMLTTGNDDLILYSLAAIILASYSYTIIEGREFESVYTADIILDATKNMFQKIGYNTNYKDLWTIMLEIINEHELRTDKYMELYWKNTCDLLLNYDEIFAKSEKDIKVLLNKIIA